MDLNAEKLTSGERAEMRDLVTSGARRMRAARARRMQTAAVAAAVVLVAAVVTGVSFAALRPDDRAAQPVETTSTPAPRPSTVTPSPTSTPTPPAVVAPVTAVLPYGGDCADMLSLDQAGEWMGTPVVSVSPRWKDVERSVAGGMECAWGVPDAYQWGYFQVTAFPAALFDPAGSAPVNAGVCDDGICWATAVVDGMWIAVKWVGAGNSSAETSLRPIGADEFAQLFTVLGGNAENSAPPRSAERAAGWWPADACGIVGAGSPGLTRQPSEPSSDIDLLRYPGQALRFAQTGADTCVWTLSDGQSVVMDIVPGGGVMFDEIAALDTAQSVQVPGSDGAVIVPNHYMWEFNGDDLLVRSGDNMLIVGSMPVELTDAVRAALIDVATSSLSLLSATVE